MRNILPSFKYKPTQELLDMAHDDLTKYFARLDEHNRKWERIEFFAMGFCLGGGLCTVLMYIVHVL